MNVFAGMAAGKRAGANSGSKKTATNSGSEDSSNGGWGSGKKSKRRDNGWPWWLWAFGIGGLLAIAGRVFTGDASPKKGAVSAKGKGPAAKAGGPLSTQRYLMLALRLQEMTTLATSLEASGALDSDAAKELDDELTTIDTELGGTEDPTARDLRSMVSVVRGTLYQRSGKLSDEEVENLTNSYTYANPRYWDDYYNKTTEEERFDWYGSWDSAVEPMTFNPKGTKDAQKASTIGDIMRPYFSKDANILMLGCGNSDMSEKMYKDGYESITNVDISESLLDKLRTRLGAAMPRMRWQFANASALAFDTGAFDATIDKGTFDAIEQNKGLLSAAAAEAYRTLKPGGYFLSVTFNDDQIRVDSHLRASSKWGDCHSHPFERQLRTAKKKGTEKSIYYVHACQRLA